MKRLSGLILMSVAFLALLSADLRAQAHFLRGDANHDGKTDISDAIYSLTFQFIGGVEIPCTDAADVNDSGDVDISDPIAWLSFEFLGAEAPKEPFRVWEADPTEDSLGCLGTPIEKTGNITTSETWDHFHTYKLVSGVFVKDGVTLTIEEGTTIIGEKATKGLLVIERGAKLIAVGTATHPIVFTSENPVGARQAGDWGGVIMLGRSQLNVTGGEEKPEGLIIEILYGGGLTPILDDDSGQLSYVRSEFGGTKIGTDNEVNAFSLFALGSKTKIDHLESKVNLDDGYEWFGGTVDARYLLSIGVQDDNFDYSKGWVGRGQFWLCQQRGPECDKGFEIDNSEGTFSELPLTNPLVSNVTLIGDNVTTGTKSTEGLLFRRGAGGRLYNALITGFAAAGLDIDDGVTTNHSPSNSELIVDNCVFFDNGPAPDHNRHCRNDETGAAEETPANSFLYTSCDFLNTLNANNILAAASPVIDPYNKANPNFRPQNDGLSTTEKPVHDLSAVDSFFQPVSYRGAVPPTGDDWTKQGWISYLDN